MESVEKVIEQNLLHAAQVIEDQVDAEIEKLEKMDDEELEAIERKRMAALRKQMKMKNEWIQNGHGDYSILDNEKEFFEACKKSSNFVCHFYRQSTMRCKIVDKHLSLLAKKHIETRFCKIDAERSPFLTERLKIRVLPTIVICKDAIVKDYIIGFDDLGGIDDFTTEVMEWRIAKAGVITYNGNLHKFPGSSNKPKNPLISYRPRNIRGGCDDSDSD